MSKTHELINEIKAGLKQKNSSQKDEVSVMRCMLNDTDYKVGVYDKTGKIGEYCPAEDFRGMLSSVMSASAHISKDEADVLIRDHEISKAEASSVVGVSKEFVNTYLKTGRKLPLGGREGTNFSLITKTVPEKVKPCPKRVGVSEDGSGIYETPTKVIPEHTGLKAQGSCPEWVKNR